MFAHIRDENKGIGNKASDISGADACFACHAKFDGQDGFPLMNQEWLFYALRGIQRTIENRIARGIMIVPIDAKKVPRVKSKPKGPKKPIKSRGFGRSEPNWKDINE